MVNYIVAKFKPEVDENCTFCATEPETIQHLLFFCNVSSRFIFECINWYNNQGLAIEAHNLKVYEFLFPQRERKRSMEGFFALLNIKYFIWLSRCYKKIPILDDFITWHSKEIDIIVKNVELYPKLGFVVNLFNNINGITP